MTADRDSSAVGHVLRRCVAVDPTEFAERHWDREPLLSRAGFAEPKGYGDLLDLADVDELLSRRGLRTPFLRLARDGRLIPPGAYTGGGGLGAEIGDQIRDDRVVELLADGATLVLQGLHRLWPPLIDFAGGLRRDLGVPVQVNAYYTPPRNRGFATHYDTHSVFVLQVAGRKRWRIHPPVLTDPIERQPWGGRADEVSATADQPPYLDTVLEPGDALYLPRGWLHAAEALADQSLHITVGLRAPTRHTILEALLDLAVEEPALRAGLPLGTDLADPDELAGPLADTVASLHDWLDTVAPATVAGRLRGSQWSAARPAPVQPLAQLAALSTVDAGDHIVARTGLSWRLVEGTERATLLMADRNLSFPAYCAEAVRAALAGPAVRVRDLPGLPDDADRVTLVRRLLKESVVVPA